MNILLVEDNDLIVKGLLYAFEKEKFNIIHKKNIKLVKEYLDQNEVQLIILDISLPDGNGLVFYKDYLKDKSIPVIFLTAYDMEDDICEALNLGAEDYITKPFSVKELIARVNRVLSRNSKFNVIKIDNLIYDVNKMELYKDNVKINLTPLELKIINLLFTNTGKVISRNVLLDKVFDWTGNYIDDHTITVYLKRIREKIDTDVIKTVKGIGYRIDEK